MSQYNAFMAGFEAGRKQAKRAMEKKAVKLPSFNSGEWQLSDESMGIEEEDWEWGNYYDYFDENGIFWGLTQRKSDGCWNGIYDGDAILMNQSSWFPTAAKAIKALEIHARDDLDYYEKRNKILRLID